MDRKTNRISVSFDPETYSRLSEIAERDDLPIAWIIRRAVKDLLNDKGNTHNNKPPIQHVSEGA